MTPEPVADTSATPCDAIELDGMTSLRLGMLFEVDGEWGDFQLIFGLIWGIGELANNIYLRLGPRIGLADVNGRMCKVFLCSGVHMFFF